jgi:hypothetical protein
VTWSLLLQDDPQDPPQIMRWGRTQTRTFPKIVSRQQQKASLGTAAIDMDRQQQTRAEDTADTWQRSQLAQRVTTSPQNPLQPTQEPFNVPLKLPLNIAVEDQPWPSPPHGQLHCKVAFYQVALSEHDDSDNSIRSAALLERQRLAQTQTQHGRTGRRSFHRQTKASALDPNKVYPQMDQANGRNMTHPGGYQTPQKRQRIETEDSPVESNR